MEREYLALLQRARLQGIKKADRTGVGTVGLFGQQLRCDLKKGFPLLTTKKVFWKGVVGELLWFLTGSTNAKPLQKQGIRIWDAWAKEDGYLGPIYGKQWRNWIGPNREEGYDQILEVIETLKKNPDSRRMIVSAWNVADLPEMSIPPCPTLFQFYTTPSIIHRRTLHCQVYQRSVDLFLGAPFDIAEYALLTHMIAQVCDMEVGELVFSYGDSHIYLNHLDQVCEQLSRDVRPLPTIRLDTTVRDIDRFKVDSFVLEGYNPHPAIGASVAV